MNVLQSLTTSRFISKIIDIFLLAALMVLRHQHENVCEHDGFFRYRLKCSSQYLISRYQNCQFILVGNPERFACDRFIFLFLWSFYLGLGTQC